MIPAWVQSLRSLLTFILLSQLVMFGAGSQASLVAALPSSQSDIRAVERMLSEFFFLVFRFLNDVTLSRASKEFKAIPLPPGAMLLETQIKFGNLLSRSNNCDYFLGSLFYSNQPLSELERFYAPYKMRTLTDGPEPARPRVQLWDDGEGEMSPSYHFGHLFKREAYDETSTEQPADGAQLYLVSIFVAGWEPDPRCF